MIEEYVLKTVNILGVLKREVIDLCRLLCRRPCSVAPPTEIFRWVQPRFTEFNAQYFYQ